MNAVKWLTGILCLIGSFLARADQILTPYQYIDTSGARELTPFSINDEQFIAIAQLAKDIPGTSPDIDGGNADVDVLVYKIQHGKFVVYQRIPGHGNENATFFTMGHDAYLAIASACSGPKVPFNYHSYSMLYKWDGTYFYPVQQFYAHAAKQWHYFNIGKRHFLALAAGIPSENKQQTITDHSMIYEWDGEQFQPFQEIPSSWGYSFQSFHIDRDYYLAFADHVKKSTLFRWDGARFKEYQVFEGDGGSAFEYFIIKNTPYLAYASLTLHSVIYQWNGKIFIPYQTLPETGGRNFTYFNLDEKHYLLKVNFITGNRTKPEAVLESPLYKWVDNQFELVQRMPSFGGVSAHVYRYDDSYYLAFANSLSESLRFKAKSVIYKISQAPVLEYG